MNAHVNRTAPVSRKERAAQIHTAMHGENKWMIAKLDERGIPVEFFFGPSREGAELFIDCMLLANPHESYCLYLFQVEAAAGRSDRRMTLKCGTVT